MVVVVVVVELVLLSFVVVVMMAAVVGVLLLLWMKSALAGAVVQSDELVRFTVQESEKGPQAQSDMCTTDKTFGGALDWAWTQFLIK